MRKKVLFETVLSVIFLVAYFAFFAQLNGIIQDLVNNADAISERLDSVFLFRWIGDACADGSGKLGDGRSRGLQCHGSGQEQ